MHGDSSEPKKILFGKKKKTKKDVEKTSMLKGVSVHDKELKGNLFSKLVRLAKDFIHKRKR